MGSPNADTYPAVKHEAVTFAASAEAATQGRLYRSLYFGASGDAEIVDSDGNAVTITVVAGLVYPLQSYGVVAAVGTDGPTTVTEGSVIGLY